MLENHRDKSGPNHPAVEVIPEAKTAEIRQR